MYIHPSDQNHSNAVFLFSSLSSNATHCGWCEQTLWTMKRNTRTSTASQLAICYCHECEWKNPVANQMVRKLLIPRGTYRVKSGYGKRVRAVAFGVRHFLSNESNQIVIKSNNIYCCLLVRRRCKYQLFFHFSCCHFHWFRIYLVCSGFFSSLLLSEQRTRKLNEFPCKLEYLRPTCIY